MVRLHWAVGILGGAAALTSPSSAAAADANGPDWAFGHPAAEAVVGGLSALSLAAVLLPQRETDWAPSSARPRTEPYATISDFSGAGIGTLWQLSGSYALETSYYRDHGAADPFGRAWRSTLVDAEAVFLSLGMTYTLKRLTGRCRPRAWKVESDGAGRCDPDAAEHDAFPSGHVSMVGAVAGSRMFLALRSQGAVAPRVAAFAFAEAATLATGVLRVLAGAHSWEDVVGGWAVSHSVGALLSLSHPMVDVADVRGAERPAARSATWIGWSGAF